MYNREFHVWMAGYLELCPENVVGRQQLYIIKNHLRLVEAVDGQLDPANRRIFEQVNAALEQSRNLETAEIANAIRVVME